MSNETSNDDNWGDDAFEATNETFEIDTAEVDTSKAVGDIFVDRPGRYHCVVTNVTAKMDGANAKGNPEAKHIQFTLKTVAENGTGKSSPVGSLGIYKIFMTTKDGERPKEWAFEAIVSWFFAIGLLRRVNVDGKEKFFRHDQDTTSLGDIVAFSEQALNQQAIVTFKTEKWDDNNGDEQSTVKPPRWAGNCWRLDAPAVEDIPKSKDHLEMWNPPAGKKKPKKAKAEKKTKKAEAKKPEPGVDPEAAKAEKAKAKQPEPVAAAASDDDDWD